MTNQDESTLQKQLACYPIEKVDDSLLDRIVQAASATPQDRKVTWTLGGFSVLKFLPWQMATAFALVALLGFGIGAAMPIYPLASTTQRAFSVNNNDLNKIIFGTTTLKEVNI